MSNYLDNLLARSLSLSTEVRPRLAHPFETFNATAGASAVSPVGEVMPEATTEEEADTRFSDASFVRTALEPPTPADVTTANSPSASSSAPAQSTSARALHDDEAPVRPGFAEERIEDGSASAGFQSPERTFTEARRASRRDRVFQLKRAEPGVTGAAQKSESSFLHEQEARQAAHESDERLDAHAELDEISPPSEARVINQRLELKPAPLDEMPMKVSTVDEGARQIVQRPSMIAPDMTRLEKLDPIANPPAAPTIRVTIGRIEVRAVMPPAMPAKERTRAAPKLSLDDYLRSQNGGKR